MSSYVVRYGQMRFLGEFTGMAEWSILAAARGAPERSRHRDGGSARSRNSANGLVSRKPYRGEILRPASPEDLNTESKLPEWRETGFAACR